MRKFRKELFYAALVPVLVFSAVQVGFIKASASQNSRLFADSTVLTASLSPRLIQTGLIIAAPTFSANPSFPTKGSVTVTINYPLTADVKEYRFENTAWTDYYGPFAVSDNCAVYARCFDTAGNVSETSQIDINNIDRTAPESPTFSPNPATPTKGNVAVTVNYPADADLKEYRFENTAWTDYYEPVIVSDNCTVYARCSDKAGNCSEPGSIAVSNIDKAAPETPVFDANPKAPTNSNVTVTVIYPADADLKEYRFENTAWTDYLTPFIVSDNCTIYARCSDAAGNESITGSVVVSSIDKTAPAVPTLSANPATPTTGSVIVTITYPSDAAVSEYKTGTGTWTLYTAPVVIFSNDTVYARCLDFAGNISGTGSVVVNNIRKLVVRDGSTSIINTETNFIYGLKPGLTRIEYENSFVRVLGNTRLEYQPDTGSLGTGNQVKLIDNDTNHVSETFTIIIFGDVNGDGNIDSIDAGKVVDFENSLITFNPAAEAVFMKAGDLNGDGNVDSIDAGIDVDAENSVLLIDQCTGFASQN